MPTSRLRIYFTPCPQADATATLWKVAERATGITLETKPPT